MRDVKTQTSERRNGVTPVGYSGRIKLRREQWHVDLLLGKYGEIATAQQLFLIVMTLKG
jgi:hypothetical protein